MLAVQAQDIAGAPLALRARTRNTTLADVVAAREARSIVRAWGPRGTLHLVAAEDLAWLTALRGPANRSQAMRRLGQTGVAGAEADLVRVTERALSGQGPLTKAEFGQRLAALGLPAQGQGIVYLAFLGAMHGRVVLGPDRGPKPTYVHAQEWLGAPVDLRVDRGAALAELARRYLRARGPASPADLAAWFGLSARDATAAFAAAGDDLVALDGSPAGPDRLWRLRHDTEKARRVTVALLPSFDEYLLSWRDRTMILDPGHAKRVIPGGGILPPTVVADGRVAGTWRSDGTVELLPGATVDEAALAAEFADVTRFLARR